MPTARSSHNLFGIKAGAGWKGPVAEVTTTEVIDGQARKVVAKFRAYAQLRGVVPGLRAADEEQPALFAGAWPHSDSASGFAQGLQRAGYATDPAYADKLTRVINTTLRLQRMTA